MKRYVRNIILDEIDIDGQKKLNETKALVVGAGGLGSHLLYHLVSLGILDITIMDSDSVAISNLQRQIAYNESDINKNKAICAANNLSLYNTNVKFTSINKNLTKVENIKNINPDIIFDCTDNYQSRVLISQASVECDIPAVFASVIEFEGWVYVQEGCHSKMLFDDIFSSHINDTNCESHGVVSPSVGFVSSIQAMEGLKVILNLSRKNTLKQINCFNYQIFELEF